VAGEKKKKGGKKREDRYFRTDFVTWVEMAIWPPTTGPTIDPNPGDGAKNAQPTPF